MHGNQYKKAFDKWFSIYDSERQKYRIPRGSSKRVPGIPYPPVSPDDAKSLIDSIGHHRVIDECNINKRTLARWLSGDSEIPRATFLLLRMWSQGRLPDMCDDWQHVRFHGDRLCIVGSRFSYTAREIMGWQYKEALITALQRRCADLESQLKHLMASASFGCANDPIAQVGNIRPSRSPWVML